MRFLILLFVLTVFPIFQAAAVPPNECDKIPGVSWKYCVYLPKNSARAGQVLYFLHSAGGWAREWEYFQEGLKPIFGDDFPTVVSLSFGDVWLLNQSNGLLPKVVNEAIPMIEAKVLKKVPTERLLFGWSMGGFNGTQLVLQHPELFSRAALLCPGYLTFNPHDDAAIVDAYLKRTGADSRAVGGLLQMIRAAFPTRESWDNEAPLMGGAALLSEKTPPMFLATAKDDTYGFYEGSAKFVELAQARGASVRFSEKMRDHCKGIDFSELAGFLEPQ